MDPHAGPPAFKIKKKKNPIIVQNGLCQKIEETRHDA